MENAIALQPMYYNRERLIKQPVILYRTNQGDDRYYYTITEFGEVQSFASVTTVLGSTMPTSKYLIEWIAKYGMERAEQLKKEKAEYGTLMHICISNFLTSGSFDLSTIPARIETYKHSNGINYDTRFWAPELEKDMRAFEVFAAYHDVEPLAISLMLFHPVLGFAGELDCVLNMQIGTGVNGNILKNDVKVDKKTGVIVEDKRKRIIVIMDWKSGRHGFYPNNEAQLHLYKSLWDYHYPNIPIDALYNWSPKNWHEEPDYNLKDQMDSLESQKIQHYVDLFNIGSKKGIARYYPKYEGIIVLGRQNGNFKVETFEEKTQRIHRVKVNGNGNGNGKVNGTTEPNPETVGTLRDLVDAEIADGSTIFDPLHALAEQIRINPVQPTAANSIEALLHSINP